MLRIEFSAIISSDLFLNPYSAAPSSLSAKSALSIWLRVGNAPTSRHRRRTANEMFWGGDEDEDENLLYSPALVARRASESWIDTLPVEVLFSIVRPKRLKNN